MYALGQPVTLSWNTYDAAGALANVTTFTVTVELPDLTTTLPMVSNPSTGTYSITYLPPQTGLYGVAPVATGTNASAIPPDSFNVDAAKSTGIVSLADVRAHLNMTATGITGRANDDELRRFIDVATDFIESRIGPVVRRTIGPITVYPQGGLFFLTPPVISVTTMTYANGYTGSYDVAGVYLDGSAGIIRPAYTSTFAYPVSVTYVGGRAIVPALIQQAALDYIKWMWESQRGSSLLPIAGGEFEVTTPMMPPHKIELALQPYMTVAIA